jgi:hypothetical protein
VLKVEPTNDFHHLNTCAVEIPCTTQPYTTVIGECTRLPYTSKREVQEEGGGKARVFPSFHHQEDDQRDDIYYTNDSILYSLLCL